MSAPNKLPRWADIGLLPLVSLTAALLVSCGVIARELDAGPQVLLVGQPTRGVDIGAIEFIHKKIVAMRDAGKAVLLVSVELDEILGLADRILVIAGGEIVGEVARADATEERLGLMMAGVRETHA